MIIAETIFNILESTPLKEQERFKRMYEERFQKPLGTLKVKKKKSNKKPLLSDVEATEIAVQIIKNQAKRNKEKATRQSEKP